jgi:hypothetical protein
LESSQTQVEKPGIIQRIQWIGSSSCELKNDLMEVIEEGQAESKKVQHKPNISISCRSPQRTAVWRSRATGF